MITLTLDYTCVIDLAEKRMPWVEPLEHLLQLHQERRIDIAIPVTSAAENQPGGSTLTNYNQFHQRLAGWGLTTLTALPSVAVVGAAFVGLCTVAGDRDVELMEKLKGIVHPDLLGGYARFCDVHQLNPKDEKADKRFRNKTMDVMAILTHIYHRREMFIARDHDAFFRAGKREKLIGLGAGDVLQPCCALEAVLRRLGNVPPRYFER